MGVFKTKTKTKTKSKTKTKIKTETGELTHEAVGTFWQTGVLNGVFKRG